jgi:hypothetical protein
MANVPPYHTNSKHYSHGNVHHDHSYCPDGKQILPQHRALGKGGKPRCKVCISLG